MLLFQGNKILLKLLKRELTIDFLQVLGSQMFPKDLFFLYSEKMDNIGFVWGFVNYSFIELIHQVNFSEAIFMCVQL